MKQFLKLCVGFFAFCIVLVGFLYMFAPTSMRPAFTRNTTRNAMTIDAAVNASNASHRSDKPAQDNNHQGQ